MSFTDEQEDIWIETEVCNLCDKLLYVEDIYEVYHKIPGLGVVCDCCYMEVENETAS